MIISTSCPAVKMNPWSDDHLSTRWSKTKMDQGGKRAFNIALMANPYDWKLCPITALAVWLSCTSISGNAVFPGPKQNKRYSEGLKTFLLRADGPTIIYPSPVCVRASIFPVCRTYLCYAWITGDILLD